MFEWLDDIMYRYKNFIIDFYNSILRFFYWGWKLRKSYDWDYHFLEEMILLKLKKIHKEVKTKGHLLWNQIERPAIGEEDRAEWKSMQSLELAIYLLERLQKRSDILYAKNAHRKHDEKWGELEVIFSDRRLISTRSNILTKEDEIQEGEDFKKLMQLNTNIYNRDRKYLYNILLKYGQGWWD